MRKLWLASWSLAPPVLLIPGQAQTPPRDNPGQDKLAQKAALRGADKLPEAAQPIYYSARRALEWLKLTNKPDGRFVYGFNPSLRVPIDGDNFRSQAGATFALARASRYFNDEHGMAIARQALLALRLETMVDPDDKTQRFTAAPPTAVNRISSQGLFISAIHELATPGEDLLQTADQMANYLKAQQSKDGSIQVVMGTSVVRSANPETDAEHAGWGLQGILHSHKHRPATWKLEMARNAQAYYLPQWQNNKSVTVACSHVPAYAEAYVQTKDTAFADAVFAMADWLVGLQYREDGHSPRQHWNGGFPSMRDGKVEQVAPDIHSARVAECLAEACRVAKLKGDLPRLQRYETAFLHTAHFLMSLQYTPAKTEHFVDRFRPSILGAFHGSHQDGNLRIDQTQHPLCAMVQYLESVVE